MAAAVHLTPRPLSMRNLEAYVKSDLKRKHINVPDAWITECIDFVISDNEGIGNNCRAVAEKVYEQWQYSDLTQLATSCLPLALSQQRVTKIKGVFPLQVNKVKDIGAPAYSQLQKIQKTHRENDDVSADQPHQPSFEPKPSRVLLLELTDGTQVVQGMEYKPIPALTISLRPGTKILVSGEIVSRRGMLLLTPDNIRVIGGDVETLLIVNALENILLRQLGQDETETPHQYEFIPDSQVIPSHPSQIHTQPQPQPTQIRTHPQPTQKRTHQQPIHRHTQPLQNTDTGQPFTQSAATTVGQLVTGMGRRAGGQEIASTNRAFTPAPTCQSPYDMDDEFFNEDMEAVLCQIEKEASPPQPTQATTGSMAGSSQIGVGSCAGRVGVFTAWDNLGGGSRSNTGIGGSSVVGSGAGNSGGNVMKRNCSEMEDDFFNDGYDDLFKGDFDVLSPSPISPHSPKRGRVDDHEESLSLSSKLGRQLHAHNMTINSTSKHLGSVKHSSDFSSKLPTSLKKESQLSRASQLSKISTTASINPVSSKISNISRPWPSQPTVRPKKEEGKPKNQQLSLMNFVKKLTPKASEDSSSSANQSSNLDIGGGVGESTPSTSTDSGETSKAPGSSGLKKGVGDIPVKDPPIQWLNNIPKPPLNEEDVMVRAHIKSLLSRLKDMNGDWGLKMLIADFTGTAEVDVAPQVLNELIGVSIGELKRRKAEGEDKAKLKALLNQGVQKCRDMLSKLQCLFHLHLSPSSPLPVLTALTASDAAEARLLGLNWDEIHDPSP